MRECADAGPMVENLGIELRRETTADLDALSHLLLAVDAAWDEPFRLDVREGGFDAARIVIGAPHEPGIVAVSDTAIVGYAALCRVMKSSAVLTNVMVHPDWEGNGLGRRIVGKLCMEARTAGRHLELEVLEDSVKAVRLYESLGFKTNGRGKANRSERTVLYMGSSW